MSVAFRREGDDEHLEPKFELPIPPGPNLVTARGKALIDAKVAELTARVAEPLDEGALTAAKRDLRYWQTRQVTAEVQPEPDGSVVAFGTRVTFLLNGKERVLGLVGDDEADPAAGLVAFSAPLARALMGAEEGELLAFNGREDAIEVVAVEAL
ncbi:GreA/GreB family elongation factor [Novosphingobium beihaiensis]|uniref:GreA/GreB family elongation factor n=1 Tax=Novosphingobium beihaiensis TaxID=2930389 RepID=A0ABT0BMV1_9SPHN|nr:GreA/GreB family elongation factor [Novosphingobium beihaiensis]MCJ2186044.1 GreA/GreB family elongation factor [Novosphingobium beihaiensis]